MDDFNKNNTVHFLLSLLECIADYWHLDVGRSIITFMIWMCLRSTLALQVEKKHCGAVKPVSTSAELVNWFCHYWTVKVYVDVFHSVIEKVKIIHILPYDLESMDGISEARMSHFIKHLLHQLFFKSPTHISGWTDTENVKTYFDVSLEEK